MSIKKIRKQSEKIVELVTSIEKREVIRAVERDLLLSKLAALYERVLEEVPAEEEQAPAKEELEEQIERVELQPAEFTPSIIEVQPHAAEQNQSEAEVEAEGEVNVEVDAEVEAEPEPEQQSEEQEQESGSDAEDDMDILQKSRKSRKSLFSLYGESSSDEVLVDLKPSDNQPEPSEPELKPESKQTQREAELQRENNPAEVIIEKIDEKEIEIDEIIEAQTAENRSINNFTEESDEEVESSKRGEIVADQHTSQSGVETLSDRFVAEAHTPNIAEAIGSSPLTSLTSALGINDRYSLARELFNGNISELETALEALDRCTSFDEAIIYISDNYSWESTSEGGSTILNLLRRKFGL